ncbi:MAG: glycogen synthase [Bacteroidetes bacterium GWF2_38_335]|nr:MAG: glycogen synthase [Bacteroidetes bacterium GWF2_38_335]OFY76991.1 MAG: glycogen synthase [Bacteroidetes bacterium RIFOXYA12_FULL_38_20]HBS86847.1 glycogen synthase [Bacteroidales bacterium]
MEKTKVLFVSQEITPYLPETPMSVIGRYLPQGIQDKGKEIRTFMPKFGCINERRNQLHEVIRLSGMNLIIDDTDHPLLIKVASIQAARMQVYFIDNEDFFNRKNILVEENGDYFSDNDERAIFFARGVLETVKKLRWAPDVVHCHGWFTNLVPLYIRRAFKEDPIFNHSKIVYSVYDDDFSGSLHKEYIRKVMLEGVHKEDIEILKKPDFVNVTKMAINISDAVIIASEKINPEVESYLKTIKKPVLKYHGPEQYIDAYSVFYDEILKKK